MVIVVSFVKYQHISTFTFWLLFCFLDRRQRGPIRSVLLVTIGWLFGWLVGKAVFSEMTLRIFLIFCRKLGEYRARKVTEPDFWIKFLIWRYSRKSLQISPKSDTLIFFSKTALTIFLVFGLKLVLNTTFNLNETYFSEKLAIWRYLDFASLLFLNFAHVGMSSCFLTIRRSSQCILVTNWDLSLLNIKVL